MTEPASHSTAKARVAATAFIAPRNSRRSIEYSPAALMVVARTNVMFSDYYIAPGRRSVLARSSDLQAISEARYFRGGHDWDAAMPRMHETFSGWNCLLD